MGEEGMREGRGEEGRERGREGGRRKGGKKEGEEEGREEYTLWGPSVHVLITLSWCMHLSQLVLLLLGPLIRWWWVPLLFGCCPGLFVMAVDGCHCCQVWCRGCSLSLWAFTFECDFRLLWVLIRSVGIHS